MARKSLKQKGKSTRGRATAFRRNMEQLLRDDEFYTRFYPAYEEQIANLSAFRGKSTPNIKKEISRINAEIDGMKSISEWEREILRSSRLEAMFQAMGAD